jgi:hypothetical protein
MRTLQLSDLLANWAGILYQMMLPGLVLACSGDGAAVGLAIFLSGVSRIALTLVGGALSDRVSARFLLQCAYGGRAVLSLALSGLVWSGGLSLTGLYAVCLALGLTEALANPARGALQARVISPGQLQQANALISGQEKLLALVGPGIAGGILAAGAQAGLGDAPALAAVSAALQALALVGAAGLLGLLPFVRRSASSGLRVAFNVKEAAGRSRAPGRGQFPGRDLVRLLWGYKRLSVWLALVFAVNAASIGPLCIGLPVLAVTRFADQPQALAWLMTASGGGALLGTLLPGWLPVLSTRRLAVLAPGLLAAGLAGLWLAAWVWLEALAALLLAALMGYINVIGVTRIQQETPSAYLGRMMGLLNLK